MALRKAKKITQTELANLLNCKQPTIHDYEKGRVSPNVPTIQLIATTYNVNLNWLLTGNGSMFLSETIQESEKIEELEKKLRENMEKTIQRAVEKTVEMKMSAIFKSDMSLMGSFKEPNQDEASDFWYLEIQGDIACGEPQPFVEDASERLIPVSKRILQSPTDCDILRVNGDSMMPDLEHSDLVIIRKETNWLNCNNRIVAVRNSDGLTLKKLVHDERKRTAMLVASNKKYSPIVVDETFHLCGYLIFLMRYF